jgi:hypothetical protein
MKSQPRLKPLLEMVSLQPKSRMIYPEKSIVYCNSNCFAPVSRHFAAPPAPHLTPQSQLTQIGQAIKTFQRQIRPELGHRASGRARYALGLVHSASWPIPFPVYSAYLLVPPSNPVRLSPPFPMPRCSTFPVRPRLTLRVRRFYALRLSFSFPLFVFFFFFVRLHSRLMH